MPLIRLFINRISGEKTPSLIGTKIAYATVFNVYMKKDAQAKGDEAIYDFTLSLNSQPPGITISLGGTSYIKFQDKDEYQAYKNMDKKKKGAFIASIVFPQVYTTLLIIAKELQIPPPLIKFDDSLVSSRDRGKFNNFMSV